MNSTQLVLGPVLVSVCVVMVLASAVVYRVAAIGSVWTVPWVSLRGVVQLAVVAGVLVAAMARLWSSALVLVGMFVVAGVTAAKRIRASRGAAWTAGALAVGWVSVLPLLLVSGAVLSLGMSERDSRMGVIDRVAATSLLPTVDSTRTVGLVTLPGAFVGVLLSTGSAAQAAAVQILILIALLLSQTCAVAVTIELIARGIICRGPRTAS